jgi:ParB-like chromosome segregation protein Spo0J
MSDTNKALKEVNKSIAELNRMKREQAKRVEKIGDLLKDDEHARAMLKELNKMTKADDTAMKKILKDAKNLL